jgi:hypothetical protein
MHPHFIKLIKLNFTIATIVDFVFFIEFLRNHFFFKNKIIDRSKVKLVWILNLFLFLLGQSLLGVTWNGQKNTTLI